MTRKYGFSLGTGLPRAWGIIILEKRDASLGTLRVSGTPAASRLKAALARRQLGVFGPRASQVQVLHFRSKNLGLMFWVSGRAWKGARSQGGSLRR